MEENVRENKMGTMPIGKLLANMAGPVMVSMLFQALYNIVDSVFVARLSQDAMNAVSLAFPLQMLCIAFSVGTGVGMNALLARSLGEKNQTAVNRAAGTGLFLTLCTAAVFMLLGFSLATPFFRFQTTNEQIIAYGQDYVRICIGCSLGIFVQVYSERLLQATGRTNLSMISQIVGAVCNIVLDPILIFGLLGFPAWKSRAQLSPRSRVSSSAPPSALCSTTRKTPMCSCACRAFVPTAQRWRTFTPSAFPRSSCSPSAR